MALLEIKNVSKRFGGLKAVSEVSMAVEAFHKRNGLPSMEADRTS